MTRRVFQSCLAAVPFYTSCSAAGTKLGPEVLAWERHLQLAILNPFWGDGAVSLRREALGRLNLPGYFTDLAVSPYAERVAWLVLDQAMVSTFDGNVSANALLPVGNGYSNLAINAKATRMVVKATRNYHCRVLLLQQDEMILDLTDLLGRIKPETIEDLQFDADGKLLRISTRDAISVLELKSRSTIFECRGSSSSMDPNGRQLAFLEGHRLILRNLQDGKSRHLNLDGRVWGVGAWSPDSQFLLAGTTGQFEFERRVTLIDVSRARRVQLDINLDEGDYGNRCRWIKRALISTRPSHQIDQNQ